MTPLHLTGPPQVGWAETWSLDVWGGTTTELLQSLDPNVPHVVVEGHGVPSRPQQWSRETLPLSDEPGSQRRLTVRHLRYDLLLSYEETIGLAETLDRAGDGGLLMWQTTDVPDQYRLLDHAQEAWRKAMGGLSINLIIERPHLGEVAILRFNNQLTMEEALARMGLT